MSVVRALAMFLSAAAFGASLVASFAYAIVLRWERSWYGVHVMIAMLVVTGLFGAIRYQYTTFPGRDAVMVAALCPVLVVTAWRIVIILRRPDKGADQ